MSNEKPDEKPAKFEAPAKHRSQSSMVGEMIAFLRTNKKWWLIPILVTIFLIGVLVLLSGTVAAPFIYTLF